MGGSGKRLKLALTLVSVLACAIPLATYFTGSLNRTELDTVDARFSIRGTENPPNDLVVVSVDDVTFSDLDQQWPFPRSLHGEMIDLLSEAGAEAILYDVQFTEPTVPREDNALVNAVADSDVPVILATEEVNRNGGTNVFGGDSVLRQIGARAGNSAYNPDPGGVWRRMPFATDGLKSLPVVTVEERDGVRLDPASFPEDGAWIDFYGPPETVPTYSFSEVLNGKVEPSEFEGKTVVVGAGAPSLQDVHAVPTSDNELMAGAEVQATAVDSVARSLPLSEASWPLGALLIIALGTVAPAAGLRLRPLAAAGVGLLAGALYLVCAQLAFNAGLIVPVVDPLLALVLGMVGMLAVHYTLAAFERQRVHDTFARFVPADVVGEVLKRTDGDLRLGGSRRVCSVLFSDIRGFTSYAESQPPDLVVEVLNRYLGTMTDSIMDHGGTLVSFMGDGIMAVFGAPLDQPDHADRALASARDMVGERLDEFNAWLRDSGHSDGFKIGIGINSGEVMAGQVGSARRVEYTTIGDTTNTAARLEGMTKGSAYSVFVSGGTREMLGSDEGLVFVEQLEVRGRSNSIEVWADRGSAQ